MGNFNPITKRRTREIIEFDLGFRGLKKKGVDGGVDLFYYCCDIWTSNRKQYYTITRNTRMRKTPGRTEIHTPNIMNLSIFIEKKKLFFL